MIHSYSSDVNLYLTKLTGFKRQSPISSIARNNHNKTLLHTYSENNLFFQYQKHYARVTATNCTANTLATSLPVNPMWVRALAWIQSSN